jgi:hypothetical protein
MPQMNRPTRNLSVPDTTTPLREYPPTEELPSPPAVAPAAAAELPRVELRTTVEHRGRAFTIVASGMTLDQFCDLLDRRGYASPAQTQEWQRLPDGTPICPKHHAPMRAREKQGDTWYSHNVGTKEQPIYCKGYHGKDSPGYEKE